MMKQLGALLLIVTLMVAYVFTAVPNNKRTLVVIDSNDVKNTHSKFFAQLQKRGYNLEFALEGSSIKLAQYGEYNYDNLILIAPKASCK